AEDGIRDKLVTGVQTCALPISAALGDAIAALVAKHALERQVARDARAAVHLDGSIQDARADLAGVNLGGRHFKDRVFALVQPPRSEERRVGKECECRWCGVQ